MKVLSIGTDRNLFDENSDVRRRVIEYGHLAEELHIIVFTGRKLSRQMREKLEIAENVFLYPTNSRSRWFYVYDAVKIGKKIIGNSCHEALVTSQDPFECGLVGWLIKRKFNIPLQLQIHTDFLNPFFVRESYLNKIRIKLAKFLIPRADGIRVVSERIKKSLSNVKCQMSNVYVLPIRIDAEKIRNMPVKIDLRKKYPQFDFIILMASRLTKEKNIGLAIDVMKDFPKAGLIIVGDGPEKKCQMSDVKCQILDNNVKFENAVDFETLVSYYKTADLFLLVSNYEGYGRTLIEAAVAGCDIISSDVGVAREILEEENIFEIGNREDLREKLAGAIEGRIKPVRNFIPQTKEEYFNEYKKSWVSCLR